MLILTIRTDKPEAEVGLFEDDQQLVYETWEAHRSLAETILTKLKKVLDKTKKNYDAISYIIVYEGPGSFTGLRIGIAVANALAYSLDVPIVAATGNDWVMLGIIKIRNGERNKLVFPQYGAPVHITTPKH